MAIRVGIVGTGGISRAHHRAYTAVGGFEIVAVCDIIAEKARETAEKWGVPKKHVFTSYNKMLEMDEIDTVSVCTYNQAHRQPTVAALNAGKHVFCEKPMAATLADATAMVRAAKVSGRILQIGVKSAFTPQLQFAKKVSLETYTIPNRQGVDVEAHRDGHLSIKRQQGQGQS